jgi:hypothetical protein
MSVYSTDVKIRRSTQESGRPGHRRRQVRIGRAQLALYRTGWQHGHTAVLIIQRIQNSDMCQVRIVDNRKWGTNLSEGSLSLSDCTMMIALPWR